MADESSVAVCDGVFEKVGIGVVLGVRLSVIVGDGVTVLEGVSVVEGVLLGI